MEHANFKHYLAILARKHGLVGGAWMAYLDEDDIDSAWRRVIEELAGPDGRLAAAGAVYARVTSNRQSDKMCVLLSQLCRVLPSARASKSLTRIWCAQALDPLGLRRGRVRRRGGRDGRTGACGTVRVCAECVQGAPTSLFLRDARPKIRR